MNTNGFKEPNTIYLLAYGTLRNNAGAPNKYLMRQAEYIDTVQVEGFDLYDLGAYPGVKVNSDSKIPLTCDLFAINQSTFEDLDQYEGCKEDGKGLYERIQFSVFVDKGDHGDMEDAWIYIYNMEVGNAKLVESGDWFKR